MAYVNEISQSQKDSPYDSTYMSKLIKTESRKEFARIWGERVMGS